MDETGATASGPAAPVDRFVDRDLSGVVFDRVDLSGARLRNVYLTGAVVRGAWVEDVDIDGEIRGLVVNGVDVTDYVEAELDRRQPGRARMRPTDADGFREAWAVLEDLWAGTTERARALARIDPELVHERVLDEWSFVETVRHLLFAIDAWVGRAYLGDPTPYHPLGLPHDEMEEAEVAASVPGSGSSARPSLDEVLAARAVRSAQVRQVFADLTDDRLAELTEPVPGPGYPASESFEVRRCLRAVIQEEWHHRLFAERDLAVLEARAVPQGSAEG